MGRSAQSTIGLVGDIMLCERPDEQHRVNSPNFEALTAALHQHEVTVANLEMPLSRRGQPMPKRTNLRSDPDVIHEVKAMGIDLVTLANNHILDYGLVAMFDTIEACTAAGLAYCGVGANLEEALRPTRLTVDGQRVALLSVSCTVPNGSEATAEKAGMAPIRVNSAFEVDPTDMSEQPGMMPRVRTWARQGDREVVCRLITKLKAEPAMVIVGIHWGAQPNCLSPYQGLLAEYQRPLGRALIDAGADIVYGHHSHTLHPIEVYRGKPIFYSLGNFLFEQPFYNLGNSLFEQPRYFMDPESVIVAVSPSHPFEIKLIPVLLDGQGFPCLASGEQAVRVLRKLDRLSAPLGTQLKVATDHARLPVKL